MACDTRKSENVQEFEVELAASFPGLDESSVSPEHICHSVLVCLDCGFTDLDIPAKELQALKPIRAACGS